MAQEADSPLAKKADWLLNLYLAHKKDKQFVRSQNIIETTMINLLTEYKSPKRKLQLLRNPFSVLVTLNFY